MLKQVRCAALTLLANSLLAQPVAAQFGPFSLPSKPAPSAKTSDTRAASPSTGCKSPKKKKGAALFGAIVGNIAGNVIGRNGAMRFVPVGQFSGVLTEAIACRLDPEEQEMAATATDKATRTGKVGTTAVWESETRDNVTGSSTIVAKTASADGATCMDVSDVVIVDGEETRVDKKMCRAKGAKGYVLAA